MVQIIPRIAFKHSTSVSTLYIPHGSDNTSFSNHQLAISMPLYIPHGSDNTSSFQFEFFPLYRPFNATDSCVF